MWNIVAAHIVQKIVLVVAPSACRHRIDMGIVQERCPNTIIECFVILSRVDVFSSSSSDL